MNQSRERWRPAAGVYLILGVYPHWPKKPIPQTIPEPTVLWEGTERPVPNAKCLGVLLWGTRGSCHLEGLSGLGAGEKGEGAGTGRML